jgi:hypothetical protein
MPTYSLSRLERMYLQRQTTFGTINGSPTNNNACRFIRMNLSNETASIVRPDKTGSRSQTVGIAGRKFGRWSTEMSMAASGSAGSVPDADPLLYALFGNQTSVASTSVTYNFTEASDENIQLATIWSYRTPSTLDQRVAHTAVVQEATFNVGQDGAATWSCQGECLWVLGSNYFSQASTQELAGLGSYPTEPASPVTNGGIVAGFTGLIQIYNPAATVATDGWLNNTLSAGSATTLATIRTAQIRVQTQNMMVKDTFGSYYPTLTEGGERNVGVSFSIYDDDSASLEGIKYASNTKTPVSFTMQVGTVAGSIWTFTLNNVQLAPFTLNDQQLRFSMDVGESRAFSTTLTSLDELTLVLT